MVSSTEIQSPRVKFGKYKKEDFFPVVKRRVEAYFKERNMPYTGTTRLYVKAAILTVIYFAIYISIISNQFQLTGLVILYGLLGMTKGIVGFNLIHDALHGAFSSSKKFNRILGYWFDINGTSSFIWKISHNIHHHIYTNIPGHDDDIDKAIILRLNTSDKVYWFHKYQYIYAPILYGMICLNWVFYSDYNWFVREAKNHNAKWSDYLIFFTLKVVNLLMFLILPMVILTVPWWYVALGFLSMHVCGGILISIVFQLAHIVDNVSYIEPNEEGRIEKNWAEHEMMTTSNFATENRLLTELVGGLNFQVEHHLFPYISHTHFPEVSKIVKATAKEFGIPYYEQPTFYEAICSHFRTLKRLGS
ncbi:MAG: acyl-CoA desaturase [Chlamydiota bacterium]